MSRRELAPILNETLDPNEAVKAHMEFPGKFWRN